jgi:vacuolar-type H+-ATPase subunit H
MTRKDAPDPRAGGLALLVETEDRLEAMLVLRREEADRLLQEARLRAAERLRSLDDEIAARETHLQREIEEQATAAAREAGIEGERRSARWRDVPEGRLDELAGLVIERLLDEVGGAE